MSTPFSCTCPCCGRSFELTPICPHCQQAVSAVAATLDLPGNPAPAETIDLPARDPLPPTETFRGQGQPAYVPETIGRYQIRRLVGEGAFGRVYEAYDPQLKRTVALKVAKLGTVGDAQRRKRFLREAEAAGNSRHPHIVAVFDAGEDGDRLFIASDFIRGQTLEARLQQGRLDRLQAVRIVRKLAEALAYAHGKGVVHRDVKPANVMLSEDGEPLLMDFGLAALQEQTEKLTHEHGVLGTPLYMSPEQARGQGATRDRPATSTPWVSSCFSCWRARRPLPALLPWSSPTTRLLTPLPCDALIRPCRATWRPSV